MVKEKLMQTRYLDQDAKKSLINRLSRACGQVNAVKKMVEESECVDKLLIQIATAKSALTHVALELMEKHLVNCTETCMAGDREEIVKRVTRALASVIKSG